MQILKILALLLLVLQAAAQDKEVRLASTIDAVTVYKKNARILRKTKVNVPAGKSELILEKLSPKILVNSIQIKIQNQNIALVSAVPRVNYLKESQVSTRYQMVKDSIEWGSRALKELALEEKVLKMTKKTLLDNNPLGSAKKAGFTVQEVKEVMEFKRKELAALEKELLALSYQKIDLETRQRKWQQQLYHLSAAQSKATGEIVLQLQASKAAATDLEIVYVVTNAGWKPLYDLKSAGVGQPLELVYKAQVYQSTGFDWKQVNMELSSSDPSLSHDRPILNPMNLDLLVGNYKAKQKKGNTYIQYQGSGNVVLEQDFIKNQRERSISSAITSTATVNSADMGEAINSNGSRSASNDIYIDGVRVIGNVGPVETAIEFDTEALFGDDNHNINFDLDLLQDIPSDGEQHIVEVKHYEVPVNYEYHIVPKIDKGAFLLAKITNYGRYNLLSGAANIFFDGVYLGQSYLDAKVTTDTLLLSLGRDEKISVRREKLKGTRKEFGSMVKENLAFEISIRNNKSEAIPITVLDQIPVSKNKDLEIKLLKSEGAVFYAPYGSLRWRQTVQPNTTQKLRFDYEVKYPKGRGVFKTN